MSSSSSAPQDSKGITGAGGGGGGGGGAAKDATGTATRAKDTLASGKAEMAAARQDVTEAKKEVDEAQDKVDEAQDKVAAAAEKLDAIEDQLCQGDLSEERRKVLEGRNIRAQKAHALAQEAHVLAQEAHASAQRFLEAQRELLVEQQRTEATGAQGPDGDVLTALIDRVDQHVDQRVDQRVRQLQRSAAGSSTHAERWAKFSQGAVEARAGTFFRGVPLASTIPDLPAPLQPANLERQFSALSKLSRYEVDVIQPTFMHAVAAAVAAHGGAAVNEWRPTTRPTELREVQLPNMSVLKMFVGSQNWIRGRLSPDFGVFVADYTASEFSCLLIGEADDKGSTRVGLTAGHLGKTLVYEEEVLRLCPFRGQANGFVYAFVTNNITVRFLRSTVHGLNRDGSLDVGAETTMEMKMEAAWPWLWTLLTASPRALGYTLPDVAIDGVRLDLTGIAGRGAQGVCYKAIFPTTLGGCKHPVIVKISTNHDELYRERRVLGALRTPGPEGVRVAQLLEHGCRGTTAGPGSGESEVGPARTADGGWSGRAVASSGAGSHSGAGGGVAVEASHCEDASSRVGPLCDADFQLDEDAQLCVPEVVAYGIGVLVLKSVAAPFHEGECAKHGLCAEHIKQLLHLHQQLVEQRVLHNDICPRHLLCGPDHHLLVIDWGFALLDGDSFGVRVSRSRYQPAPDSGGNRHAQQLHSMVKSVYAMLHPAFEAVLRCEALNDAPSVWNTEWGGDAGSQWKTMAACVENAVSHLPNYGRGGATS